MIKKLYIKEVAIKTGTLIFSGKSYEDLPSEVRNNKERILGFIDNKKNFHTPADAAMIAYEAKQIEFPKDFLSPGDL